MTGHLDGNAIAGLLLDLFGSEMTTAVGLCATCGARHQAGELRVYLDAPGVVVRCPSCRSVVMVLVTVRDITCIDLRGLDALDLSG